MIYLLIFLASVALTYGIRRYADSARLIDIPNERSSHERPTPRGGGLAIVAVFFGALVAFRDTLDPKLFWALCMALPIALAGLIDDRYTLSARSRLLIQFGSAAAALAFLGGVGSVNLGFVTLSGIWLNLPALVMIVWFTNLYNFMDGIDGYAAAEGITIALGGYLLFGHSELLLLACAIAGFLVFNWHKASIFMGDVGSATLGFLFAVWTLADAGTNHFSGWLTLSALFWFDATLTLFRRWKNGERLSQAHKKHLYQRLHQSGYSHDRIVWIGTALNLIALGTLLIVPDRFHLFVLGFDIIILIGYLRFTDRRKGFA